jgi:uncharacterized protein
MSRVRMTVVALAVLAAIAVAAVALAGREDDRTNRTAVITVGEAAVQADIAGDEAARQRGLSGRRRLAPDAGMLFLLSDDSPSFWMKGMRFPIDILWIKNGRIVDVSADVPPPAGNGAGPLPTYSPDAPADRALEVNAGWAARHDVGRGDSVRVKTPGGDP